MGGPTDSVEDVVLADHDLAHVGHRVQQPIKDQRSAGDDIDATGMHHRDRRALGAGLPTPPQKKPRGGCGPPWLFGLPNPVTTV